LVVVGTSAGGIDALPRLLSQLPGTFPASIVIVMHLRARENAHLVHILQRAATLPVQWAEQGERLQKGRVYVGPPDMHLTLLDGHLRLSRGARENFARPSIDRMLRSVAAHHGSRAIAVLLTGMMGDGVAGLLAVHGVGGRTIVQDPKDAQFNELPSRALAAFEPSAVLRLEAMGPMLIDLTNEHAPEVTPPREVLLEAEMDRLGTVSPREMDQLGTRVEQMCPDCGGPLWQIGSEKLRRWRCYLGHVHGARQLLDQSDENVEAALWSAIRALHERAATWETLACDAEASGGDRVASDYATRARETREQAELARRFMLDLLRRPE